MTSWTLKNLDAVPKNGYRVFSAFSCGGGSSMGYKLDGFDVIGNCEIDPKIAAVYQHNLHPCLSYVMDIRQLNAKPNLPPELYSLDILDGSPPCSVFSMAGQREEAWGKTKRFREGQVPQTLDDLFFEFIQLAERIQPRVVIAENVKGLLQGNAKGYVHEILKAFDSAGYQVQLFCLNAANMGVPQRRERVFFIGHRKDLKWPKLTLHFSEPPILFREVRSARGKPSDSYYAGLLKHKCRTDKDISDINKRMTGKENGYNNQIIWDDTVAQTITSNGTMFRAYDDCQLSDRDLIHCQTFPEDYDFCGMNAQYVCGMSVPPVMMQKIAGEIRYQWFDAEK